VSQIKFHVRRIGVWPLAVSTTTAGGSFLLGFAFLLRVPSNSSWHKMGPKSIDYFHQERVASHCGRCRCGLLELHTTMSGLKLNWQFSNATMVPKSFMLSALTGRANSYVTGVGNRCKRGLSLRRRSRIKVLAHHDLGRQSVASILKSAPRNLRGKRNPYRQVRGPKADGN
jgi:hypothetical protein